MDPGNPLKFFLFTYFSNSLTMWIKLHEVAKSLNYFAQQNEITTTFLGLIENKNISA